MLKSQTPAGWFDVCTKDLGALLSDHMHCERKAAENALSLVRKYPHNHRFVETLARLAHEETSHVIQVTLLLEELGIAPRGDMPNHYTRGLLAEARNNEPHRRVDLMLCAAFIEARSHERLVLLAQGFTRTGNGRLADFYNVLANAEERHAQVFVELASMYEDAQVVRERMESLGQHEAKVLADLGMGCRVH
jgi:tRNA 2-(methylsulfanyl)-N6-isopentenyladenosine37 hydroxylase